MCIRHILYSSLVFIRANEKYEPLQGKAGLALLAENGNGNKTLKTYRLILYQKIQNKQKAIASTKITHSFVLTVTK